MTGAAGVISASTADAQVSHFAAARRFQTRLLAAFSALALVLATVGVFSVVHYMVTLQRREIGVRLAIGARRQEVIALVIARGMTLVLPGLVGGVIGSVILARILDHMLFGIAPADPLSLIAAVVTLTAAALAASAIPAWNASRVDCVTALSDK